MPALELSADFTSPLGIVGDLGGGSLELAAINDGVTSGVTLPLGGLRLRELAEGSLEKARNITRDHLKKSRIGWPKGKKTFFAVGGTWRSLGKLHIANQHYPLPSVHEYMIDADDMMRFCRKVVSEDISEFRGMTAVSKNRRELLPYGAVVLREIIDICEPEVIAMSSLGCARRAFCFHA